MQRENQQRVFRKRLLGMVLFCLLMACSSAFAQEGREFAGFYDFSNVSKSGDAYLLTLRLHVFNYGVTDVNYGTLTLEDSLPTEEHYGTLSGIYLPAGESIRLTEDFTVPARLYGEWQRGISPCVNLKYQMPGGSTKSRMIELVLMPLEEEE